MLVFELKQPREYLGGLSSATPPSLARPSCPPCLTGSFLLLWQPARPAPGVPPDCVHLLTHFEVLTSSRQDIKITNNKYSKKTINAKNYISTNPWSLIQNKIDVNVFNLRFNVQG